MFVCFFNILIKTSNVSLMVPNTKEITKVYVSAFKWLRFNSKPTPLPLTAAQAKQLTYHSSLQIGEL